MPQSKVVAIYIGAIRGGPMTAVGSVEALAGQGLAGDRYCAGEGTFSKAGVPDREVTLIESEAVEAVNRDQKLPLTASESRRNIVTEGIALNHLIGKEFRVGDAKLRGLDLCEPCSRLQKLTRPGMIKALLHRGGLRAEILEGGLVIVGDRIEVVETNPILS